MNTRIAELDGLRGIAILLVLAVHLKSTPLPWGWAGVELFFVLSGYLITGIILEGMDRPGFLRTFYIRRALRIWPIYYLTIAVVGLLPTWKPVGVGYFITYTQNVSLYIVDAPGSAPFYPVWWPLLPTWSLAVEEQFYLLWPLLLLWLGRKAVVTLALATLLAAAVMRQGGFSLYLLGTRCDGLALGSLLAVGPSLEVRWQRAGLIAAGAVILLIGAFGPSGLRLSKDFVHPTTEIPVAALASFLTVAFILRFRGSLFVRPLRWSPLGYVGTISYGLYLYHFPIYGLTRILVTRVPGVPAWPFEIAGAMVVAILSWHLIERPILRLKARWDYG
jgi:peptidoglycan/LPS O-acetylase OafA/YrhL